jgi:hypothetical protein
VASCERMEDTPEEYERDLDLEEDDPDYSGHASVDILDRGVVESDDRGSGGHYSTF